MAACSGARDPAALPVSGSVVMQHPEDPLNMRRTTHALGQSTAGCSGIQTHTRACVPSPRAMRSSRQPRAETGWM